MESINKQVPVSQVSSIFIGGTPSRRVPQCWNGDIKWATARDIARCSTH